MIGCAEIEMTTKLQQIVVNLLTVILLVLAWHVLVWAIIPVRWGFATPLKQGYPLVGGLEGASLTDDDLS